MKKVLKEFHKADSSPSGLSSLVEEKLLIDELAPLSLESEKEGSSFQKSPIEPSLERIASLVHEDDVHALHTWDQYIISGSKDTTVRLFTLDGEQLDVLTQEKSRSYENWVTGMDVFHDGSLVIGSRNGKLQCLSLDKKVYFRKSLKADEFSYLYDSRSYSSKEPSKKQAYRKHNSKERNSYRITGIKCIKSQSEEEFAALIGMSQIFFQISFGDNKILRKYWFEDPEWVYGFEQIGQTLVAAIHGASLSLFELKNEDGKDMDFSHKSLLVKEDPRERSPGFRPFISAVNKMLQNSWQLALSFFGGKTEVIDIETKKVLHRSFEHRTKYTKEERVWQALPFSNSEYLSCADDRTIKVWDVRAGVNSVATMDGHPGRVSSLALINNSTRFIAGTCADNPCEDERKGCFYFYDLRKKKPDQIDDLGLNDHSPVDGLSNA